MAEPARIVIVGSGLAGATAATALRANGYSGEVVLFGQEPHLPYELPALSKGLLLGETDEPDWVADADFYAEHSIDLRRSTRIRELRPADRVVVDDAGAELGFDRLVLATGSAPRTLPIPGADLAGLHTVRTLDDSLALREKLTAGANVVVVGAGWIGCEVAAAARTHGCEVAVVELDSLPLRRVLGDTVSAVYRDVHAEHGVDWRLDSGVDEFVGDGTRITAVRLVDGTELPADLVVVGVGAAPRLELADRAGLRISDAVPGRGVEVDATLATPAEGIFAIGDIAAHDHPRLGRLRVEHWANAKEQGGHVAANLLGADAPFTASPYFFSDQYELGMEYRGLAAAEDEVVIRGDLAERAFHAFWLRDGRVRAAMNVNLWDDGDALQALVDRSAAATAEQLRTADLAGLAE